MKYDLEERTIKFSRDLIEFCEKIPKTYINEPIIIQLVKSATSIGANYIEAIAGSSKKDFTNFLSHALKSANETKFWLALIRDIGKGDRLTMENLLKELTEISNILASSVRTLRGK